jgi:hypothetical protein
MWLPTPVLSVDFLQMEDETMTFQVNGKRCHTTLIRRTSKNKRHRRRFELRFYSRGWRALAHLFEES